MDVLRSCYSGTWNFPGVGRVRGYYFFAAPGTPSYERWHWFGSRNWHKGDGTDWPEFGELETTRQTWRDGSFPFPQPPAVQIGSEICIGSWLEPQAVLETPPLRLIAGIDARCFFDFNVNYIIGSGGIRKNGNARFDHHHELIASGGIKKNGKAVFGPGGGVRKDGSAAFSFSASMIGAGGVRKDGSALEQENFTIVGAGGVRKDGVAPVSFSLSLLAAGGVRKDGAAFETINKNIVGAGGLRLDGAATLISPRIIGGHGGKHVSGHAFFAHAPGFLGSGGVKKKGHGLLPKTLFTQSGGWDGLCSIAPVFQGSLALSVGAGITVVMSPGDGFYDNAAAWETLWLSPPGTMTASLHMIAFVGGVTPHWKFQVQIIRGDCTILYTSPYSAIQSGPATATLTDVGWIGTAAPNHRIRLVLAVQAASGVVTSTISNDSGSKVALPG